MTEEVVWTRSQRDNTLAGISVIREVQAGGPQYVGVDGVQGVEDALERLGEPTVGEGLIRVLAGVTNAACLLLDWIESEAQNKQTLLEAVGRSLRDFEEPDSYPTDPSWSTWEGVLLAIEKTARKSPTAD